MALRQARLIWPEDGEMSDVGDDVDGDVLLPLPEEDGAVDKDDCGEVVFVLEDDDDDNDDDAVDDGDEDEVSVLELSEDLVMVELAAVVGKADVGEGVVVASCRLYWIKLALI
jgi:hypothetical protein